MRKIKYIAAIICTAVLMTSCNDFLDKDAQGKYTDKVATNESTVFGVYALMRSYNITAGIPAFAVHLYRSEDSEKGSTANDGPNMADMYDDFNYVSTQGSLNAYWDHNYKIILQCNDVIDALKPTSSDYDKIVGAEAKFFRAYCYFNLVRAFGEVPKVDFKVNGATETNVPKSSVDEIYKLIDQDLSDAVSSLPRMWEASFQGRITWGAARSLQARTFMMRNDWGKMYEASKEVIDSKIYRLDMTSDKIFTDEGELCNESIFELVCTATVAKPSSTSIGSQFCEVQGIRGSGTWNLGWGWHMATKEIDNAFEENDPRRDASLLYFRRSSDEAVTASNTNRPYGESPISEGMGSYYNKKAYTDPAMRAKYSKAGFWVNIRLIRYADVLLMGAEAANELGNSGDALLWLEEVRARARKSKYSDVAYQSDLLPEVTTTDQMKLRDAIKRERRAELALEFDRFYDLVRWGDAEKVLHAAGKTNYQHKHRYFPIPQDQIDLSDGVLIQNPDYTE